MYRRKSKQLGFHEFFVPFSEYLNPDNRWVRMSRLIPWEELEKGYAQKMSSLTGAPAKPFRTALGALIIQHLLKIHDRELIDQITENHYMQYFIGREAYLDEPPFSISTLKRFRKRIDKATLERAVETVRNGIPWTADASD
jgi:transposase, IS5 family